MSFDSLVDAIDRGDGWTPFRPFRNKTRNGRGDTARCMSCGSRTRPKEVRYVSTKIKGGGRCVLCKGCLER